MLTNPFFQEAMKEAKLSFNNNEVPVGALIVNGEGIVARSGNIMCSSNNPLNHAEMLVIQKALALIGSAEIKKCDLYVTLFPCPMCFHAASLVKIRRIYCGPENKVINDKMGYKPECYEGFCANESSSLLKQFFARLRNINKTKK